MAAESLKFFLMKDPIELTQAVREVFTDRRRVTGLKTGELLFNTDSRYVFLRTAPAHKRIGYEEMEIPNQTRPHAIYESLQPVKGPIDGVNRI
jgi:hypothetical protein